VTAGQEFRDAVRSAAAYSADGGTQGWLLSEEQFGLIFTAGEKYAAAALLSLAAEIDQYRALLADAVSPAALLAWAGAARMARERAGEGP